MEYAESLWIVDDGPTSQITPDLLLPEGYPEIIFMLGGGYKKRAFSSAGSSFTIEGSVVIGIQEQPIMSRPVGALKCIGIKFNPMGFYGFFGDVGPASFNRHLSLAEFGNEGLLKLDADISKMESISEAIQIIETFFDQHPPKVTISEAWKITSDCQKAIRMAKGTLDINALARTHHMNRDELDRCFIKFMGLPASKMAEIIKTLTAFREKEDQGQLPTPPSALLLGDLSREINIDPPDEPKGG